MRVPGRIAGPGHPRVGPTRAERSARARRRRALAHLARVRNRREAPGAAASWRLAAAILAASLAAGAWLAGEWLAGARLTTLSVGGARHVSVREIAAASGVAPGVALAEVDRGAVAARLAEHAWIEEARALVLPTGRLLVAVVEREPVAVLAGPEPRAVDATGTPFAPAPASGLETLPRLVAAQAPASGEPHAELAEAAALARRLPQLGLAEPTEVRIAAPEDPEGLSLRLPGLAPRVVLGREDLDAKLADLARLLKAELPELAGATRLDLRFRDQAVLDVTPPSKGAAQAAASRGRAAPSGKGPAG